MSDKLHENLILATVGSCTCHTKTPELKHHAVDCHYKLFIQAASRISELEAANRIGAKAHDDLTEKARKMRDRIEELEALRDQILESATRCLIPDCDIHGDYYRKVPFHEIKSLVEDFGCPACHKEKNMALQCSKQRHAALLEKLRELISDVNKLNELLRWDRDGWDAPESIVFAASDLSKNARAIIEQEKATLQSGGAVDGG